MSFSMCETFIVSMNHGLGFDLLLICWLVDDGSCWTSAVRYEG